MQPEPPNLLRNSELKNKGVFTAFFIMSIGQSRFAALLSRVTASNPDGEVSAMRWQRKGQLNITAADLALLSSPSFRDKLRDNIDACFNAGSSYPPIPSAVFFVLLNAAQEKNPKLLWKQYRLLLEVSNHPERYYRQYSITVHGKSRTVAEPLHPLFRYQKWILKNILDRAPLSDCAFAYRKGRTLTDNARVHRGKAVLVKLDISHFFDSITFGMVYRVFSEQMQYPREGATLLANLCCLNGRLPQGACTSPCLSNLVFAGADREFLAYCEQNGLSYSRYSDDLSFSGDAVDVGALLAFARQTLRKHGFRLNDKKTHVDGRGRQHKVTGVVCNEKLSAPAAYRRQLRQEMYYLKKHGVREHLAHRGDARFTADDGMADAEAYLFSLLGRISFVLQVDPGREEFREYCEIVKQYLKQEERRRELWDSDEFAFLR